MLIKSRVVLTSALALLALSACNSKEAEKTPAASQSVAAPAANSAIAATVNGTTISQKQVDLIMKQQATQGMPDNAESRKMVIDNLAMQLIVAQESSKKGLDKSPEIADQLEMTRQSILADAYVQDYIKNNTVTDAMLAAEYDKIKTQASGNQYKARHILVEKEADAKDIIAKLKKNPKAFEALAKAQSKDPGSKDKGGDLGWFDPHGMVPEFGAAVAKLEKDKFTEEPVKSQFGYHVIMLDDTRANPIPTLEQVKPRLTQQVQQQNLKKMLDELKSKAKIEIVAAPVAAVTAPASAVAATPAPAETAKK
ncbi:MAG: peptidylprolyl isomerase [Undibacterium sp.]|uniref:peptidylprolyl isomerase n=1 Tax=Undibacterium sp. TaxID=1914977 RepID=UPI00271EA327|nr:peptidylprolyl isomerase [Undibacterium sp.]MDO8654569.1 peptidylprolyl isomerase [Undibacterium sp.]